MTLTQLLAAIQRELDTAMDLRVPPGERRRASDVLTYQVLVWETPGDVGQEINSVRVNHDQRIVWLET